MARISSQLKHVLAAPSGGAQGAGRRAPSLLGAVLQEGRKSATVHAGVRQRSWDPNRGIAPCRGGSVIGSRLWKIRAAQSRALIQGGRTMQKMTRRALGAAGPAVIVATTAGQCES